MPLLSYYPAISACVCDLNLYPSNTPLPIHCLINLPPALSGALLCISGRSDLFTLSVEITAEPRPKGSNYSRVCDTAFVG